MRQFFETHYVNGQWFGVTRQYSVRNAALLVSCYCCYGYCCLKREKKTPCFKIVSVLDQALYSPTFCFLDLLSDSVYHGSSAWEVKGCEQIHVFVGQKYLSSMFLLGTLPVIYKEWLVFCNNMVKRCSG